MATVKISDLSVGDWVEIDHEHYGWKPAQLSVCGEFDTWMTLMLHSALPMMLILLMRSTIW